MVELSRTQVSRVKELSSLVESDYGVKYITACMDKNASDIIISKYKNYLNRIQIKDGIDMSDWAYSALLLDILDSLEKHSERAKDKYTDMGNLKTCNVFIKKYFELLNSIKTYIHNNNSIDPHHLYQSYINPKQCVELLYIPFEEIITKSSLFADVDDTEYIHFICYISKYIKLLIG